MTSILIFYFVTEAPVEVDTKLVTSLKSGYTEEIKVILFVFVTSIPSSVLYCLTKTGVIIESILVTVTVVVFLVVES